MSSTINPLNQQIITIASNDPTNPTGSNANFSNLFPFQIPLQGDYVVTLLQVDFQPAAIFTPYYVYTSLIYPQIVGSFSVNLLATIPGQPVLTPALYRQQDPQEWRQVSQKAVSQIEVTIRDGLGNIPVFASPTIITLLLQKV